MTDRVLVNKTKTALLPDNSPRAGIRILRTEAHELGLLDSPDKPVQQRRTVTAQPAQKRRSAPRKKKA